jgi:hypothetical protein
LFIFFKSFLSFTDCIMSTSLHAYRKRLT